MRNLYAKCKVGVHEHLDKSCSAVWKERLLGHYEHTGKQIGHHGGTTFQYFRSEALYRIPRRIDKSAKDAKIILDFVGDSKYKNTIRCRRSSGVEQLIRNQ